MKEVNISIERIGDCFIITENGVTRKLVGNFSFEAVGDISLINFKGHEPNPFDGWIKCSDRLPEEGQAVLVCDSNTVIFCAEMYDGEFQPDDFPNVPKQGAKITYWRPLPPLPTAPLDH